MKKRSLFIVVAMVLLLAVVLGMGGTTFAKYITSNNIPAQTATVAKWGYVITFDTSKLFGTDYTKDATAYAKVVADDSGVAVSAKTSAGNIVAPGTSGSFDINVAGTAEVLSRLTFVMNSQAIKFGTYEPIKWAVSGTVNDATVSADDLTLAELESTLEGYTRDVNIGVTTAVDLTVTWTWDFETAKTPDGNYNVEDTKLGHLAALTEVEYDALYGAGAHAADIADYEGEMSLDLTVTIEQLQEATPVTP